MKTKDNEKKVKKARKTGKDELDKSKKEKKKSKKEKKDRKEKHARREKPKSVAELSDRIAALKLPNPKYICAPMVGGSELAFRLLCRRYGCTLAYTPMISSARFPLDEQYREEEFQVTDQDRPLVAHFSGNNPDEMLASAKLVEHRCDAIDLNLGCPQRIAHAGHFGSFLLDEVDRELILSIVRKLSENISIPIFVKIRLLNTVPETIRLCQQLAEAGASLIAIHARYRVNLVGRTGPGARDGAAHLDQVAEIRKVVSDKVAIIANGNIIKHNDLQANLDVTGADGVMSAEGLLDNPALFTPENLQPPKVQLACEYIELAEKYPVKMKSVIFHTRRILREELNAYQLMDDCVSCENIAQVKAVVLQAKEYFEKGNFVYNPEKELAAKNALAKRKHEEGKRKRFEERMLRKAKREGKDPSFYLNKGLEAPSLEALRSMKAMSKEDAFQIWKENHSQHCFEYHFNDDKCHRDRTCAFLHVDPSFVSNDADVFG
jgi:tRNA-dihydrouridine synthase 1